MILLRVRVGKHLCLIIFVWLYNVVISKLAVRKTPISTLMACFEPEA